MGQEKGSSLDYLSPLHTLTILTSHAIVVVVEKLHSNRRNYFHL